MLPWRMRTTSIICVERGDGHMRRRTNHGIFVEMGRRAQTMLLAKRSGNRTETTAITINTTKLNLVFNMHQLMMEMKSWYGVFVRNDSERDNDRKKSTAER